MFFNLKSCIMRYLFSSKSNEEKIKTERLRCMFYGWRIGLNDFKIDYSRQDEIAFLKKACYDIKLVKKVFDEHYETEWGCYYDIEKDKIISVHIVDEEEEEEELAETPVENEVKEVEKVVESVVEKVLEKIEEEEIEVEEIEIEVEVEVSVKKEDDVEVEDIEEEKEEKRRKYLTGYILFCKANRSDAIEELKATTGSDDPLPTDVIKKLASMWNELKKTQPAVAKGWNEKAKDIKEDDDE